MSHLLPTGNSYCQWTYTDNSVSHMLALGAQQQSMRAGRYTEQSELLCQLRPFRFFLSNIFIFLYHAVPHDRTESANVIF